MMSWFVTWLVISGLIATHSAEDPQVDPKGYVVYCPCMGQSIFFTIITKNCHLDLEGKNCRGRKSKNDYFAKAVQSLVKLRTIRLFVSCPTTHVNSFETSHEHASVLCFLFVQP